MQHQLTRALAAAGFSFLFALTAACGGAKPEAKSPGANADGAPGVGSSAPDLVSDNSAAAAAADAPKPTVAVVSADNGSDIIPPFSSSKEPAKKSSNAKGSRKGGAKPKKKG